MERPFRAYTGNDPYIFICYAHADAEIVCPELVWLKEHGRNVWYDEGIAPGEEWTQELADAKRHAPFLPCRQYGLCVCDPRLRAQR